MWVIVCCHARVNSWSGLEAGPIRLYFSITSCLLHFYHPLYALIFIYKLWGPVSISIFHRLLLYTNLLYSLMVWVFIFKFFKYFYVSVYVVHFYHPLYALILIYKVWGPLSISISHHLILYTNLLDDVGCLYFTLSPNTNVPFKSWGPESIGPFSPPFTTRYML